MLLLLVSPSSISIHAPRAGCDYHPMQMSRQSPEFQSTHPVRGATFAIFLLSTSDQFQSTHPVRGATQANITWNRKVLFQSTHPVRGATVSVNALTTGKTNFNPRTPCGVRLLQIFWHIAVDVFQSTHPVRGATLQIQDAKPDIFDFNPRTPCGVRLLSDQMMIEYSNISIHAPRAGCDTNTPPDRLPDESFQSTHPVRGATPNVDDEWRLGRNFNPRTPCGVRLIE